MSKTMKLLTTVLFLSIFLLVVNEGPTAYAVENTKICEGVYIDTVDISGMSREEAEEALNNHILELRNKEITIMVGDNKVTTTMGNIGYTYENNRYIDQAQALGKTGNLIRRYKELKDIEKGNITYKLSYTYDQNKLKEIIEVEAGKYNIAPTNAGVKRENGGFSYTDAKAGSKIDIETTFQLIDEKIKAWDQNNIQVAAVMVEDTPKYTKADVMKTKDLLGTYTTEYTSSAEGRAANLANGARLINNTVLYPGDTFSAYVYLSPFTEANGYYAANAYSQGKVIDSIGGGACQVTTTLYNALLFAELEVVERQAHSMTISYVDLSRDAAIAGTYKDLKFRNNTDYPILIEATTQGKKITFNIWGNEVRNPNRTIEFVTVKLSETAPGKDVITEDPSKPTTYRSVTQSAHTGYKAELHKVVYENGVEVSRSLVNRSSYMATPRYVTVGTKVIKEPVAQKPVEINNTVPDESGGEIEAQPNPVETPKTSRNNNTDDVVAED